MCVAGLPCSLQHYSVMVESTLAIIEHFCDFAHGVTQAQKSFMQERPCGCFVSHANAIALDNV